MKKYLILMLAAAAALVSCGKETLAPEVEVPENVNETVQATPITFNLSANHPDATKAVKEDWQDGDVIYVFFTGAEAPKHLKMNFDGSTWTSAEYDGATLTAGALGLKNGDTGTMRAVFLPFGSDATVSADGTSFTFSTTYYAYYLTATLSYTVSDNQVSGAFNMVIPDNYVQFFVEDAAATDGGYTLGTDAVIPVGVASIDKYGNVVETSDKVAGNDMTGYAYSGGYLFSGKLNGSYAYSGNYYFAKTKTADGSRADYFVTGKTITSHSAVKLPASSNVYSPSSTSGKWVPVGSGISVMIEMSNGIINTIQYYQTCNVGMTKPEQRGTTYNFADANALDGVTLPSRGDFLNLINYGTWTGITVNGIKGAVVKGISGFIFLPATSITLNMYWSRTGKDDDLGYVLRVPITNYIGDEAELLKTVENLVRALGN